MKKFTNQDGRTFYRVSRWIEVKTAYDITPRNAMFDYSMDSYGRKPYDAEFDSTDGTYCDYFRFRGRNYATERFYLLCSMWINAPETLVSTDGEKVFLSAVDMDGNMFNPLYVEFDKCCEHVRVYEQA